MSILFFDTETTGIPINHNAPIANIDNWPRIVQLAWIVCDNNRKIISRNNYVVKPMGFTIPESAVEIHGINMEYAEKAGKPIHHIIKEFSKAVNSVDIIVGHNIDFDINVTGCEMYRLGITGILEKKPNICTMKSSIEYCLFDTEYGSRYPKLQELHTKLFSFPFENAHDAFSDIKATFNCFWKLIDLGFINKEQFPNSLISEKEKQDAIKKYCNLAYEYTIGAKGKPHNSLRQSLEYYLKAAKLGDAFAQFQVGIRYGNGRLTSVENNPEKAKYWFTKAAENGCIDANKSLGQIYEEEQQYVLSRQYYKEWETKTLDNIVLGDINALNDMAASFKYGKGKEKNILKAKELFKIGADKGDLRSIGEYCCILKDEGDYNKYFAYCMKRLKRAQEIKAHNILSNCYEDIGFSYYTGLGTDTNYSKAKQCFEEVLRLDSHNSKVLYSLGEIHEKGLGDGCINYSKAYALYNRVNKYSNPNVLLKLGQFYYYGFGVKKDFANAYKYLNEAEDKGISTDSLKSKAFFRVNRNNIIVLTIIIITIAALIAI